MHELQILVKKLSDHSIQIIVTPPPSKIVHMIEDLTLEKIGKHLRIEEKSRSQNGTHFDSKDKKNSSCFHCR